MRTTFAHEAVGLTALGTVLALASAPTVAEAQSHEPPDRPAVHASTPEGHWAEDPPDLDALVDFNLEESDFRVAIERYVEDKEVLQRRYPVEYSPVRRDRLRSFFEAWDERLAEVDFDRLNHEGQIDYVYLRHRVDYELEWLELEEQRWARMAELVPFADDLRAVVEERLDRRRVEPREAADVVDAAAREMARLTVELERPEEDRDRFDPDVTPGEAFRTAEYLEDLHEVLGEWHEFYSDYDPDFTWWVSEPYERFEEELEAYVEAIRHHVVGIDPAEEAPIVGDPVGEDGLEAELAVEMMPYNAEELIAIGWEELEWTEERLREVSDEMGFGDDWHEALEHVKELAPDPGEKPWIILDIADYSEEFLEDMGAITVPPLAAEVWRLGMLSPERQRQNPFFSGGEHTQVAYPTDGMRHEDKLMAMRGNSPHFNFAVVHHELIPGHHLQGFMDSRFNTHRGRLMRTPFWGEGWALYWELVLWDEDFARNDEDRIGMLHWRLHRAARIIFSLKYQLEEWTADEAVDFLIERVGHEPANARGEVRRSAQAPPLYQVAYKVGGLQFRALYEEVVEDGDMSSQEFHDAVMQGGRMPVELVRASVAGIPLEPDHEAGWRFRGDPLDDGD